MGGRAFQRLQVADMAGVVAAQGGFDLRQVGQAPVRRRPFHAERGVLQEAAKPRACAARQAKMGPQGLDQPPPSVLVSKEQVLVEQLEGPAVAPGPEDGGHLRQVLSAQSAPVRKERKQ